MEEIKEVELRSCRGKFIYNRTYNPVSLNKVSHFSPRGRAAVYKSGTGTSGRGHWDACVGTWDW